MTSSLRRLTSWTTYSIIKDVDLKSFNELATQPDLSWGSRGPGTALEELCRMTNDGLESLPDIQPFTAAAARQLCAKLTRSLQKLKLKDMIVMDVVVSGGVANNIFLREGWLFQARCFNTPISSQRLRFNTDNAAMIVWALMHRFLAYDDYPVNLRAKWSIEDVKDSWWWRLLSRHKANDFVYNKLVWVAWWRETRIGQGGEWQVTRLVSSK
ncbi:uncharacterized protein HD556DRAFT_1310468 [Suillus plorans]|uniref:Gcp-like domain-containing protein n=1 Tax=Suillus plorans TaxID=116603 RepID=A0A9P7AJF4_9AGAM|nr:uncharacterized protein HD556DRAFT_1310468 [Suillus plorans]KAG1790687.1 hypothetical protein HD556DRAFT_1310468 [Suillus plorans]